MTTDKLRRHTAYGVHIVFLDSVILRGIRLEMAKVLREAAHVAGLEGIEELVITSALDGDHMEGSRHYEGLAIDLRRWNLPDPSFFAGALWARLGAFYDVIVEDTHIHIEYDPDFGLKGRLQGIGDHQEN